MQRYGTPRQDASFGDCGNARFKEAAIQILKEQKDGISKGEDSYEKTLSLGAQPLEFRGK